MDRQAGLFERPDEIQEESLSGFRYKSGFLSREEENDLATFLGTLELKPFEFHGHLGNRRVASFGLKYDFGRRAVEKAPGFPPIIRVLLPRIAQFAGEEQDRFRQIGVNEYRAGAGIGWHKDKPEFGIIVGISLLAPAVMRFRRQRQSGWDRKSYDLEPRSIYLLSGESRTDWEHSVPEQQQLRYSLTFRTLSDRFVATKPID